MKLKKYDFESTYLLILPVSFVKDLLLLVFARFSSACFFPFLSLLMRSVSRYQKRKVKNSVFKSLPTVLMQREISACSRISKARPMMEYEKSRIQLHSKKSKYSSSSCRKKKKVPLWCIYENWVAKIWLDFERAMFDHYASEDFLDGSTHRLTLIA